MKKIYYNWQEVEHAANSIVADLLNDDWRPDYIVGITRGGLALALLLSHKLGVRLETLKVKLRDAGPDEGCETNCWMAENAFGYIPSDTRSEFYENNNSHPDHRKNILIVDDINDTGATFNWIKQDWQSSCLPNDPNWSTVWGGNVRFAVMTENLSSKFTDVDYCWHEVNKADDPVWLVYPWERDAWKKHHAE